MKIRWTLYLMFLSLVSACSVASSYLWEHEPSPKPNWLASDDLRRNTRISEEHLLKPNLVTPFEAWQLPDKKLLIGRYTRADICKKTEIDMSKLSTVPQVFAEQGKTLLFFSTQGLGSASSYLNTGAQIYVCDTGGTCPGGPFTVEAVIGKTDISQAVILVSNTDASTLTKLSKPEVRLAGMP
jgi:hypothetical protein